MRDSLREGYSLGHFRRDLSAGLIVGIIALPLSMALAIASGVPPQHGLYTAIVAGSLIAILGGSRVQVSGPTAAFVIILVPITAKFGLAGLLIATSMAGCIQLLMGIAGLGRLIQYIPYTVTTGFTAGIAVVIATLQFEGFLGLSIEQMPHHYIERVGTLAQALPTFRGSDLLVGTITLALLIYWQRWSKRIPAPLVALVVAGLLGWVLPMLIPAAGDLATIRSQFGTEAHPHGIPQLPPLPGWPWALGAVGETQLALTWEVMRELMLAAFAIAMLGAIESLLSAVVADGMAGQEHDPDAELIGQGIGNIVTPFFGGFAATGAIARTSANVRFGGRTPVAGVVHAVFILAAVLLLAPLLGMLPMAALAALLLRVAWNMSEARHFVHVLRVAPRSDVLVLLACFGLTVLFDMVIAVTVGVVMAAMLFMRRMAELTDVRMIDEHHHAVNAPVPDGVLIYEVAGPMFFGAAQKAMSTIRATRGDARIVILDMRSVPLLDMTGLVNLESALDRLARQQIYVILAGVQHQPLKVLAKAHVRHDRKLLSVCGSFADAFAMAGTLAHLLADTDHPSHGVAAID